MEDEFLLFVHDRTAIRLKAKMSQEFKLAAEMVAVEKEMMRVM